MMFLARSARRNRLLAPLFGPAVRRCPGRCGLLGRFRYEQPGDPGTVLGAWRGFDTVRDGGPELWRGTGSGTSPAVTEHARQPGLGAPGLFRGAFADVGGLALTFGVKPEESGPKSEKQEGRRDSSKRKHLCAGGPAWRWFATQRGNLPVRSTSAEHVPQPWASGWGGGEMLAGHAGTRPAGGDVVHGCGDRAPSGGHEMGLTHYSAGPGAAGAAMPAGPGHRTEKKELNGIVVVRGAGVRDGLQWAESTGRPGGAAIFPRSHPGDGHVADGIRVLREFSVSNMLQSLRPP